LSVTSWRPRGNGIGSSNCRFQPVVLREAMRALLCDMGNVDQVLHLDRKSVIAKRKFALLLRLAFLEGASRAKTIFTDNPPSRVLVFSERITFYPSGAEPKGSGTTAYAWFVWDKDAPGLAELKWIKPGYKAKFS
jgi:hypothetical protein